MQRGWRTTVLGAGGLLAAVSVALLATGWGSAVAAQAPKVTSVFIANTGEDPVPVNVLNAPKANYATLIAENVSVGASPGHATHWVDTSECARVSVILRETGRIWPPGSSPTVVLHLSADGSGPVIPAGAVTPESDGTLLPDQVTTGGGGSGYSAWIFSFPSTASAPRMGVVFPHAGLGGGFTVVKAWLYCMTRAVATTVPQATGGEGPPDERPIGGEEPEP